MKLAIHRAAVIRLHVALALGELDGASEESDRVRGFTRLLRDNPPDHWQVLAILSGVGPRPWLLLTGLLKKNSHWLGAIDGDSGFFLRKLGELVGAGGNEADLMDCGKWIGQRPASRDEPARLVVLAGMADGLARRGQKLGGWLRDRPIDRVELNNRVRELAQSDEPPLPVRLAAVRLLGEAEPEMSGPVLLTLLRRESAAPMLTSIADALARADDDELAQKVFADWDDLPRSVRSAVVSVAARSPALSKAMIEASARRKVSILEIPPAVRQALRQNSDAAIKERAESIFGATTSADREAVVQHFKPALHLEGDPRRGAAMFATACLSCHRILGQGAEVGPDLSSVGTRAKETLLIDILDPSRAVSPDHLSYTLETNDGDSFTGLITAESATQVTLRRPQLPDETVARSRIRRLQADGRSLMPDGLEQGLTLQDFSDLLAFLKRPDPGMLPPDNKSTAP